MITRLSLFLLLGLAGFARAQAPEPGLEIRFVPASAGATLGAGRFEVDILPPDLYPGEEPDTDPVPVTLSLAASLYEGDWLVDKEEIDIQAEAFVLAKYVAFRDYESPEQFRDLLDPQTYADFRNSISEGRIDLAADREVYAGYDNIRLLGSIQYGVYTLLYTQFREAESGRLYTSIMPTRMLNGRMVTAGSMAMDSHELYRMITVGTTQRRLLDVMEEMAGN